MNNKAKKICRLLSTRRGLYLAVALFVLLTSCSTHTTPSEFDPRTCLDIIPGQVKGLKILEGPRSEKSLIRDMVPPICNGHALFKNMQSKGEEIIPGRVIFHVVVEYTGEVAYVRIEDTTIRSEYFLREVRDFIMDTDFVLWAGDDGDTVFLYPASFGH
jgi:hypothetical protein